MRFVVRAVFSVPMMAAMRRVWDDSQFYDHALGHERGADEDDALVEFADEDDHLRSSKAESVV